MQIQINTDRHIKGHESFTSDISRVVEKEFDRFKDQITRIELHLSDNNGYKNGEDDKECMMEVRWKGKQPIAVTDQAESLDDAIKGALKKMMSVIEKTIGSKLVQERLAAGSIKHFQTIPNT